MHFFSSCRNYLTENERREKYTGLDWVCVQNLLGDFDKVTSFANLAELFHIVIGHAALKSKPLAEYVYEFTKAARCDLHTYQ